MEKAALKVSPLGTVEELCPHCGEKMIFTFRDWFFGTCGRCDKESAIVPNGALGLIHQKYPELLAHG
jgi:hypothetical protein